MSMLSEQINYLRVISSIMQDKDWKNAVRQAADTIEALSAKLAAVNMERSDRYYGGGWIAVEDGLPEESLNSVIGWDEYRKRCCFVQYWGGRWILGNDIDSVKIIAWQPLPERYRP